MTPGEILALRRLARRHGILTEYRDVFKRRQAATARSLMAVLRCLGVPVDGAGNLRDLLHEELRGGDGLSVEPVAIAWDGKDPGLTWRSAGGPPAGRLNFTLILESGEARSWSQKLAPHSWKGSQGNGGRWAVTPLLQRRDLPAGCHRLEIEGPHRPLSAHILSAPRRTYDDDRPRRSWGVFLPLYALRSRESWGGGDYGELGRLMEWSAGLGGRVLATLPLLPAFLEEFFEPSPYSPVSRLFWSEFYVDPRRSPELAGCEPARRLIRSAAFGRELEKLRRSGLIDYRRQMELKRNVLELLSRFLFSHDSGRREELDRFVRKNPRVEDYARFRAACERRRVSWRLWPERMRDGDLRPGDFSEATRRFYLYAQWLAQQQMEEVSARARGLKMQLYLDLPLGVHPDGFDVWRERELFARDASGGAPPDSVFTKGQDWGFAPLHPQRLRSSGYDYLRRILDHHLRHAGMLRIDHVMALHRLYWIPKGLPASEGVYVSYPSEELYALISIASHRHRAAVIGENLGTVPPAVNAGMTRHGLGKMFIVQYELRPESRRALPSVPAGAAAGLNTHDMPPFGAFWKGLDIADRMDLGLLGPKSAGRERRRRRVLKRALASFLRRRGLLEPGAPGAREVLGACLAYLGSSPARIVLVNLEDLWLEERTQNVPATTTERINWRRVARYRLEDILELAEATGCLGRLNRIREGRNSR